MEKIAAVNSTKQADIDYGRALVNQKGGWTPAEFSKPVRKNGDPTSANVENAPVKANRLAKRSEKASS